MTQREPADLTTFMSHTPQGSQSGASGRDTQPEEVVEARVPSR